MAFVVPTLDNLVAVILSGGRAQRMQGQDKGLQILAGKPLIEHIIERLQPQCKKLCINANRNLDEYARYGLPVISDMLDDFPGPLAGIHSALEQCASEWLVAVPCDTPRLPGDLVCRLREAASQSQSPVAIVHDGEYLQPTFCLIHHSLKQDLEQFILAGGRKTGQWLTSQAYTQADFSDQPEAFININTSDELLQFNQTT